MTNKNISKRIKCLLSQNKYLRRRIAELEKQWKEANEGCAVCREKYKEIIFIERGTRIFQRKELEKARHQRNYYNRMVYDLHYKIKILKEANILGEVYDVIEDTSKKKR